MGETMFKTCRFAARFLFMLSSLSAMVFQLWDLDGSKLFYLSVAACAVYILWMMFYDLKSFFRSCWPELLFCGCCLLSIRMNKTISDEYSYIRLAEASVYLLAILVNPAKTDLKSLSREKDILLGIILATITLFSAGSLLFQLLHSLGIFTLTQVKITYFTGSVLAGLYNNGNQAGIYAYIALMLSFYYWQKGRRPVFLVSMIMELMIILLSGSRTILLAMLLSAGLMIHQGILFVKLRRKQRTILEISAIAIVVIAIIAASVMKGSSYWYAQNDAYHILDRFTGGRLDLWSSAFTMFLLHPLVGVGLNNLHAAAQLELAETSVYRKPRPYENPHNTIIGLLSYTGLLGTLSFALMAAKYVRSLKRLRKDNADRILITLCAGLAFGDLFDIILLFNHRIPVYVFCYLLGYLWLKQQKQREAAG